MLTINIDDAIESRLRERAAANGRSPEDEAREVLGSALRVYPAAGSLRDGADDRSLVDEIQELFAPFGGLDLELPRRGPSSRAKPTFE
jgi:plasmid stability protein